MTTARVRWTEGMQFVGESDSGHAVVMDASPEVGGRDTGMRPMEMLLMGMAGCTAVDVVFILRKMRATVTAASVDAEADRADRHPKVFTAVRLAFHVRGRGLREKDVVKAIRLSETTYCSASAMIGKTARIETTYEIVEEESGELVATGTLAEPSDAASTE